MVPWVLTWRKEWVSMDDRSCGDIIECRMEDHREWHDGALFMLKDQSSRLEWSLGLFKLQLELSDVHSEELWLCGHTRCRGYCVRNQNIGSERNLRAFNAIRMVANIRDEGSMVAVTTIHEQNGPQAVWHFHEKKVGFGSHSGNGSVMIIFCALGVAGGCCRHDNEPIEV